jgi:transcriptional coactivator HFI1/ADA1
VICVAAGPVIQDVQSLILPSIGQLNQAELSARIDSFLVTPTGDIEHLHNQLVAAIYGNVTREMPDHGVASWVSANDKPTTGAGSKPVSGDAAEQRLKTEVMQLPSRDRRRLKDLSQNEVCLLKFISPKLCNNLQEVRSPGCFCKYLW